MDILFFAEISPYLGARVGGAENSMRLIAEGLAARGHRVVFASLNRDRGSALRRFERNGVTVLLCASPRRSLAVRALKRLRLGAGAIERRLWDRMGRQLFGAPETRGAQVLYAFYEMEFLDQALRARTKRAQRGAGFRIVMRMAGLNWFDAIRRAGDPGLAPEYARIFNAVDSINFLSHASQRLIEARAAEVGMHLAPADSFVADIGVEVAHPYAWRGPSAGDGLDIVVATRFSSYQKRQDLLVEAVALLKGPALVRVTMIGTGARAGEIARRIEALGLGDRIRILPFVPQTELWERLAGADLLCHPCDHEGVSKIILEAMMVGLPVLASDVEPLPEYVIEGRSGMRAANTPEAWAARLEAIAADKAALAPLSRSARAFVEETYDVARNIARFNAEFARLAGEG